MWKPGLVSPLLTFASRRCGLPRPNCHNSPRIYMSDMSTGERPPNFSWIIEGLLAGCAFPNKLSHFNYLLSHNITSLVTLTDFTPPVDHAPPELKWTHIPIEEFDAPSVEQMQQFTKLVDEAKENKEGVAVHCHWGRGRTGTMLAAYLVHTDGMSPKAAIHFVRVRRPYSIETMEQEDAVLKYAQQIKDNLPS